MLRDLASEFVAMKKQLAAKQNVPSEIAKLNKEISEALTIGRLDIARDKAEAVN